MGGYGHRSGIYRTCESCGKHVLFRVKDFQDSTKYTCSECGYVHWD